MVGMVEHGWHGWPWLAWLPMVGTVDHGWLRCHTMDVIDQKNDVDWHKSNMVKVVDYD